MAGVSAGVALAELAVPESWLQPHPDQAGKWVVAHPSGQYLSVAPNGVLSLVTTTGAYETWTRDGGRIATVAIGTSGADYPTGCWALPVIAGV